MGVLHGAGTHSRGDTTDAFHGCAWPVGTVGAEPDGGGGIAGGQRTYVPPLAGPPSRSWGSWSCGSPAGAVAAACAGCRNRANAGTVWRSVSRLHGEAFPRAVSEAAQLHTGLHGDQIAPAPDRPGAEGNAALGAPQEAAAPPDGGHDAASGRLDACLAGGGCRQ